MMERDNDGMYASLIANQGLMLMCLGELVESEKITNYGDTIYKAASELLVKNNNEAKENSDDSDTRSTEKTDS